MPAHPQSWPLRHQRHWLPLLLLPWLIFLSRPAQAAPLAEITCSPETAMMVQDEDDLNDAIDCFNTADTAGEYVIRLTQNISLTASLPVINNPTDGVSLLINGATHRVDGQEIDGVRPFQIATNALVTMQAITVHRRESQR